MRWMDKLKEKPGRFETKSFLLRAVLLVLVPSLLALGFNLVRPKGIPFVADTNYTDEILVPCPENLMEATAVAVADLPEDPTRFRYVDSRSRGAYLAGHIPGAINIPHRPLRADDEQYQTNIERDLEPIRSVPGEQIVVCGDPQIGCGRDLAAVLLENGFVSVRYIDGGCPAWEAAGRSFDRQEEGVVAVDVADLSPDLAGLTVIDARFSRYYRRGHLPGAIAIPYRMLDGPQDDRLAQLRGIPGRAILVYGDRERGEGEALARVLASAQWDGVRYLRGGFAAWQAAGYPVEEESSEGTGDGQ